QRADRDSYVNVLIDNVIPDLSGNLTRLGAADQNTPYDYLSIMHYYASAFAKSGGLTTIQTKNPAYQNIIGVPYVSALDQQLMVNIYGARDPGPVVEVENPGVQKLGSWKIGSAPAFSGGQVVLSNVTGDTIDANLATTTGTVALTYWPGPDRGDAIVLVNGHV